MGLGDLRHDVCSPYDPLMSLCYKSNGTEACRCDSIGYARHFNNNINGSQRQCSSGSLSPSSLVDSNSDDSDNSTIGSSCEYCQDLSHFHFSPDTDPDHRILIHLKNHTLHNQIKVPQTFYHQAMDSNCISCKKHYRHSNVETINNCQSIVPTDQTIALLPNHNMEIILNQDNVHNSDCSQVETDDEDVQSDYYDSDSDDSVSSDDQDLSTDDNDDDDEDDDDNSIQSEQSDDDDDILHPGYARLWSCSSERTTNSDDDLPSWSDVSDDEDDVDGQSPQSINQEEQQEIWESFAINSFPNSLTPCSKILNHDLISATKTVNDNKSDSHTNVNNLPNSSANVIGLDSKCKLQYREKMKLRENDDPDNDDDNNNNNDDSSQSRPTRVHFKPGNQLVKVHLMVTWSYAYRAARKGTWCQFRCDQMRFSTKIKTVGEVLHSVLQPQHREKMYNYIAQSSNASQ